MTTTHKHAIVTRSFGNLLEGALVVVESTSPTGIATVSVGDEIHHIAIEDLRADNAALHAAAPDLLAALQYLLATGPCDSFGPSAKYPEAVEAAKAAIAKAEGRS